MLKINVKGWNEKQIKEALSDENRYFCWKNTGNSNPTHNQLVSYYLANNHQMSFFERMAVEAKMQDQDREYG